MAKKYRIVKGFHIERSKEQPKDANGRANLVRYEENSVLESDVDLSVLFPGKFELVNPLIYKAQASPERLEQVRLLIESGEWTEDDRDHLESLDEKYFQRLYKQLPVKEEKDSMNRMESKYGEDVTESEVLEKGFRVFKNEEGTYWVTKDRKNAKALNTEGLKVEEVSTFIAELV